MNKFVIWALFDSGNGSYYKVAKKMKDIDIYSIGIDRENKNDHFINLDLADYGRLFGDNKIFDELDKLPSPDLIIASPPCESWSTASAMKDGNACWKQDTVENLFGEMKGSKFVVRDYEDFNDYQFFPRKQLLTRVNGELTIYNTVEIIERYKPKYFIIENPAYGRIWDYIKEVLGFEMKYENLTYYSNYDYPLMKPTKFSSNVYLGLKSKRKETGLNMNNFPGYNNRSNIPEKLIEDIFNLLLEKRKLNE